MQTENMHQLIQLNRTVRTRNTTVSKSLNGVLVHLGFLLSHGLRIGRYIEFTTASGPWTRSGPHVKLPTMFSDVLCAPGFPIDIFSLVDFRGLLTV